MEVPHSVAKALQWLGLLLILFAFVDVGLSFAGIDITGVRWSPLVSGITGSVLRRWFAVDEPE